jgi:hypothetical protein
MLAKDGSSISLIAWTIARQVRALCLATGISVFSGVAQPAAPQVELPVYAPVFQTPYGPRMLAAQIYFLLEKYISKGSNVASTLGVVFDLHLRPDRYNRNNPSDGAARL